MFIRGKNQKNDKFMYLSKTNDKTDKSATKVNDDTRTIDEEQYKAQNIKHGT